MNRKFKEECIKRFHYLDSIYDSETPEEQERIERTIYALETLLEIYKPSKTKTPKKDNRSTKEILLQERDFLKNNKKAIKLIEPLAISAPITLGDKPESIHLSKETCFELIHDFFKEVLDEETFQIFMYIFNNREYFFHYYKSHQQEKDQEVFLEYYQEPHILLNRYDSIREIYTACHEIGHAIIELHNPSYNHAGNIFDEVPSSYFEYLMLDFLKSFKAFEEITTDALQDDFDYYSDASLTITYQLELIKRCNFNKFSRKAAQRIIYALKKEHGKDDDEVYETIFNTDILLTKFSSDTLIYCVGKVIEQILFTKFNEDSEYARHIYKKLISLDWSSPYDVLQKELFKLGLKPTEASTEKYKNLILNPTSSNFKNGHRV